jgi:hypothetical protein
MVKTDAVTNLKSRSVRIARFHFALVLLFAIQTIIYHASKVVTPDLLMKRWIATASLLVVATILWYFAKNKVTSLGGFKVIIYALIITDIAFASFNVYTQRGYASKSVVLFVIPIFVAAVLASRSALYATALLSIAAYTTTDIMYFTLNFNEGYMAELYGEIGFYSALYLLLAALLWTLVRKQK